MLEAAARADRELQMVETLVECAHELAVALAAAAKAEAAHARKLELFDAFQRGFQAVRLGIRLSLTLRAPPKAAAARDETDRDQAPERPEPAEREPSDRPERERDEADREREYEAVSLPKFLSTLGVAARAAGRLEAHLPARVATDTLPRLHDVLARGPGSPPATVSSRPPGAADLLLHVRPADDRSPPRARLLGSTSAAPTARPPARPSG